MSLAPSPAALLVAVLAAAFVSELGAQTVQRRDGAEPLVAVRVDLRPEGVFCERETGATQLVPWDRVRSIEGSDDPALLEAWSRKRPVAEDLWRARARIQRGDARLAEPLLERHFDDVVADPGDTELKLIVAEGLLRVRLARGAIEAAIPAALETIRLRRAGVVTDRYESLPPVLDESRWLVPALPPMSTGVEATAALPERLRRWQDAEDAHVRALARGYLARDGAPSVEATAAGPGLLLMGAALDSRASDPALRAAARERLRALAEEASAPRWVDAWSRWFTGCSLLFEPEPDLDLALIQLLHLPARHQDRAPALASRAVALAADVLERAGRTDEAATLRRELLVSQAGVPPARPIDPLPSDHSPEPEIP